MDHKQQSENRHENCFFAPHLVYDNETLRKKLSHAERDFLFRLCSLSNRFATKDGWFWHTDKSFETKEGKVLGFAAYGFGGSTCVRTRRKLRSLGLIETRKVRTESGLWPTTMYRVNRKLLHGTRDHGGLRSETNMTLDREPLRPPD